MILGTVASAGLAIVRRDARHRRWIGGVISLGGGASTGYVIAWSARIPWRGPSRRAVGRLAMLVGQVISWAIAAPILTHMQLAAAGVSLADHTIGIWRTQVRFLGAGKIAAAAVYTLGRLAKPVMGGLVSTLVSFPRRDHGGRH